MRPPSMVMVQVGGEYSPGVAGIEYDHLFMQDRTVTFTIVDALGGGVFSNDRIRQDVDLVTVRVNYRWGGPAIPKY